MQSFVVFAALIACASAGLVGYSGVAQPIAVAQPAYAVRAAPAVLTQGVGSSYDVRTVGARLAVPAVAAAPVGVAYGASPIAYGASPIAYGASPVAYGGLGGLGVGRLY